MQAFSYRSFDSERTEALARSFRAAEPFPHLVIDNFLTHSPAEVLPVFPNAEWPHWNEFTDAYQHRKRSCSDIEALPPLFRGLIFELSQPSFLKFLETVAGLRGLLPDPYLSGGGLHSSGPGGVLAPHADFHAYGKLALFRYIEGWYNPHRRYSALGHRSPMAFETQHAK